MRKASLPDMRPKKRNISAKVLTFNIVLLMFVLVLISTAAVVMVRNVASEASENLARFYSIEAVGKFIAYFNQDLVLVEKVSLSKAVTGWFANEKNEERRLAAYDEMMDYAGMLHSASLYFVINESLNEFSVNGTATLDDFEPFDKIDPAIPYDKWYYDCINSPNPYTLNIDVDKVTNTRRLWINHKVLDGDKIVGVFCSGLPFDVIIKNLFFQYDTANAVGYVINKKGVINMYSAAPDLDFDEVDFYIHDENQDPIFASTIDSYLKGIPEKYFDEEAPPVVFRLNTGSYRFVSMAPIAGTDWSVVAFYNSRSLFSAMSLIPVLLVMLSAFVLYAMAINVLIRSLVLAPLGKMAKSISGAKLNTGEIYGQDRMDEIGEVAQTVFDLRDSLSKYNAVLIEAAQERERQDQLLQAVNRTAAVLLSSTDEVDFEASLQEGMEIMGHCMDVDRIYIWKKENIDGAPHYVQKYQWMNDLGRQKNPVSIANRYLSSYTQDWEENFIRNECVNKPIREMRAETQELLKSHGVRSILNIPVYLQDHFWGFVDFDDCHKERIFSEEETSILKSSSLMMVSAIEKNVQDIFVRDAHERLSQVLDANPLYCNLFDSQHNAIFCNEESLKLFDVKTKEEYLRRFWDLSPKYQPDGQLSREKGLAHLATAFKEGRSVFEWMHQKLDGTPIPSEITLVRIKYDDEYRVAGYGRDIRLYKKMMKEIEQRDTMLQTVNHAATILLQSEVDEFEENLHRCIGMLAELANSNRIQIWKNYFVDGKVQCSQIYQWYRGAQSNRKIQYAAESSTSEYLPNWKEKLSIGHCINSMVREMSLEEQNNLLARGILSILVVPVLLRDFFWGFVEFDDCENERVFSENEESILRSGSMVLANAVLRNEMTLSIRAALDKAEGASRAKTNFLSNMSHEIRTPMNAIIGMTAIGKSAAAIEKKDYAFEKIESASTHLLGIINDILEMSKIEAGKFELSMLEFSLEKLLQKAANVSLFRMDEKRQKFSVYFDKDIPHTLIGDDQRLTQVITNLLSNAVKFTPEEGSIRLSVHLEAAEDDLVTLRFSVKDTGIGISPEQQARLFSSFEQAESSTSRKFGGTGLGLAISKHIVELMNGKIWIESELGAGASFIFTIQAKRGEKKQESKLLADVDWSNIRVLSVDDDPDILEFFSSLAAGYNIKCDCASSGEQALQMISKDRYDVFFIDWKMPGMDGIELSRRVKEVEADKSVIIMMSAAEWNAIESEAKQAGVNDFLSKPLFPSTIVDYINKYIGNVDVSSTIKEIPREMPVFPGRHLLLAEDVEINREIVLTMLEPLELQIDCAENGAEAVGKFSEKPGFYDLVFMDLQMPEMDGFEATRRIRAFEAERQEKNVQLLGRPKGVPIIAMTANVFHEDIQKCLEAGMDDHIGKPLDFSEVIEKLKLYIKIDP